MSERITEILKAIDEGRDPLQALGADFWDPDNIVPALALILEGYEPLMRLLEAGALSWVMACVILGGIDVESRGKESSVMRVAISERKVQQALGPLLISLLVRVVGSLPEQGKPDKAFATWVRRRLQELARWEADT